MCVLAHPDDESLGTGGALAKSAAEGVATYLVTATRGERGRFGDSTEPPVPELVARAREGELLAAATELGLREVSFLDYPDGALAQVDANLAEVGTIKGRILTALVFITDMAQKDEMNRAWDEWADRANPPMRACVACGLTGDSLVEIVLTAAI